MYYSSIVTAATIEGSVKLNHTVVVQHCNFKRIFFHTLNAYKMLKLWYL